MRDLSCRGGSAVHAVVVVVALVAAALVGDTPTAGAATPSFAVSMPIVLSQGAKAVTVDPVNHTVYFGVANNVVVVDETTDSVTATRLDTVGDTTLMAVNPATSTVYVTDALNDIVSAVPATGAATTIQGNSMIESTSEPNGIAVDPDTDTIYAADAAYNGVYRGNVGVINGATNRLTADVYAHTFSVPYAVAVDPITDTVYATDYANSTVFVINGATDAVTATIPVGPGPSGIAVDPGTHQVYVTSSVDNTVSVISEITRAVTATIPVPAEPSAVAVDTRSHTAEVVDYLARTVTMINDSSNTIAATVAIGPYPTAIAVDPTTHNTYVTTDGGIDVITPTSAPTPVTSVPPADLNADGHSVPATVSSTHAWSIAGHPTAVRFGLAGDIPAVTDDSSGVAHIGVFRPSNGTWYIDQPGHAITKTQWGATGDIPVAAHYSGLDRASVLATYRPSTGKWYIRGTPSFTYGTTGGIPVPGHYYGTTATDHADQAAVFRPSTGTWYIRGHAAIHYGNPGDVPITGDFTAAGTTSITIYRPSDGTWHVRGLGTIAYTATPATPIEKSP